MNDRGLIASPFARLLKLGGLVGRVGASVAVRELAALGGPASERERRRRETLARNAARIVETLGELKGAAMKVGQMLSLHEGLLPPEISAALRTLQRQAPPIPFEVVGYELDAALPGWRERFVELDPAAFAAASIGQVHRGRLRDGRRVAVKVQYPLIDQVLEADLDNLKLLLETLFALVSEADFEPIWQEVRDRLREEVDYGREAATQRRLAELHAPFPEIVIPRLVEEGCARNVLTTELEEGLSPEEACAAAPALRDRWGVALHDFTLRGLFTFRLLHADPNLANFAFRPDGRVVVYDFGCVKEVPSAVAAGYAELARAGVAGAAAEIPGILRRLGVYKGEGEPLAVELVEPWLALVGEMFRAAPVYRFGEDESVYGRLTELGWANVGEASDLTFPRDILFIDRTLGGLFGNLVRLRAAGPWRERLLAAAATAPVAPREEALPPGHPQGRRSRR